ncbi:MAG: glycosyltransferase [Patescibacteria group bacterium]|nr:glycosyltransferase [Patescibacteria group bacterium]
MKKIVKPNSLKLSILLPVRNEGINIKLMLKILESILNIPHEILIIYDDRKDETLPVIKSMRTNYPNIQPVLNKFGRGIINAIKAGANQAKGEYILILAVDDVGPALAIEDMVALMDRGCDLVSCTRYSHGGRRLGGSLVQSILSQAGNKVFSFLCGSILSDLTTGFKMFRKDILEIISLESKPIGWAVVFELVIKAQIKGMKLGEVPIISIDRLYGGKSSFSIGPWFKEYMRWFLYGILNVRSLRRNKKTLVRIPKSVAL